MTYSADSLKAAIFHLEAIKLTQEWVKEMLSRLPALEAALKSGNLPGISPAEDVREFKAAIAAMPYMRPEEMPAYDMEATLAKYRAALLKLNTAVPVAALPPKADGFRAWED